MADQPVSGPTVEHASMGFGNWWMLFILLMLYTGSFVDRLTIAMLVPPIKADLGLTDFQMSFILGPAFAIFYVIFGIPFGWAADRFQRRLVIFSGASFWGLAALGSGLSSSFLMLLCCRFAIGAGEASISPAAYSLMADRIPRRRLTTAMGLYQIGSPLGTAISFAVGGAVFGWATNLGPVELPVLGTLQPWQLTLLSVAAPFVLLPLLIFTIAEPPRIAPKPTVGERQNLFGFMRREWRLFLPMVIGLGMIVTLAGSLGAWVPTYITRRFGLAPDEFGSTLGLITMVSALTLVLKGWIIDWLYARGMHDAHLRFFTWLIAAALPTSVSAFTTSTPLLFFLLYGMLHMFVGQFVVYAAATIQLVTPEFLRGQVLGFFMSLFGLVGFGSGPLVTAAITDYVFRDEAMLGYSLLTVSIVTIVLSWVALRLTLSAIRLRVVTASAELLV